LERAAAPAELDVARARVELGSALDARFPERLSCADLSVRSEGELRERFPAANFVLRSLKGKVEKENASTPNEWCPASGYPSFMYLAVPTGKVPPSELERHVRHWMDNGDFDETRQVGFWMYTAYKRALPTRFAFLADRIMNLENLFPDSYEQALRETLRGILAVSPTTFDWSPYLARKAGEQRL
jgi:hypothetical protein